MPIWNGSKAEPFSGATERSRLGPPPPLPLPKANATPGGDETALSHEVVVLAGGGLRVSGSHDSDATLNPKSGQHFGDDQQQQLTTADSKKFSPQIADEALVVVAITEQIPSEAAAPSPAKSYLRRLGDYLNSRRTRTTSSGEETGEMKSPNVIFSDSSGAEDQVMKQSQGNFVICSVPLIGNSKNSGEPTSSSSTVQIQDTSDIISDVDMEGNNGQNIVASASVVGRQSGTRMGRASGATSKGTTAYHLPRVFLNKEGTSRSSSNGSRGTPPFKLHQQHGNGENISNSVSISGSERGADNKSSGYCSSNLYSSGSVEEHIYSEPLVADIVPRIVVVPEDVIDAEPAKGLAVGSGTEGVGGRTQPTVMRVMKASTTSHSSNFSRSSSDKIIITDESDNADVGIVVEEYEAPLVHHPSDPIIVKRLNPSQSMRPAKAFSYNGHSAIAGVEQGLSLSDLPYDKAHAANKYPTIDSALIRRMSGGGGGTSRKLPTIMEGIDGQIPRPIWPSDMDDSLMDINLDSFLYTNEKREADQHRTRRSSSPIYETAAVAGSGNNNGSAHPNDIENNYRCMKYLNSCPENPYLVEGVEDLQMSVDKSLALYLKKCDDSLTMQNTRDFLEDIRSKLNVLLENHARHSQFQLRSKSDSIVYQKSVALIERQIEKLRYDLDSYIRLFNRTNELQIKQLCTGLAKDARIQTLQNAIENRHNSLRSSSSNGQRDSMLSVHDSTTTTTLNRLPFHRSPVAANDISAPDDEDNELVSSDNYDKMGDRWQQNVNIISQYPENDLSSYFDTVYVQDGFNMGYKVNNMGDGGNYCDGGRPTPLPPSLASPPVVTLSDYEKALNGTGNRNSVASSTDPNFHLKRNPSLSMSVASHRYNSDRHPILASRDYEIPAHEVPATTPTDDSLNDSDSVRSHQRHNIKDGQLVHNMLMMQQKCFSNSMTMEARKSGSSVDTQQELFRQEWHKNKPSIWELYYGINRPKQSMMGKKMTAAVVVSSGKKKNSAIPYPSTRPESDFTLDVPRAEQLQLKMKKDKQFRNRCRIITSFLSLIFFLLTVMVVSLVLTRGKRMFGSMI